MDATIHSIVRPLSFPARQVSARFPNAARLPGLEIQPRHDRSLSPIEQLVPEVLLTIRDVLDISDQLVLGLTCKRLYHIMARKLDPILYTLTEKIKISQRIQIDHPEYLTCRLCGALFKWRHRARLSYACPAKHKSDREYNVRPRLIIVKIYSSIAINLETIDLISRYHERGPKMGVSANWLNQTGISCTNIPLETKARWVNGQLIVRTQWTLEPTLLRVPNQNIWRNVETCRHDKKYLKWQLTLTKFLEQADKIQRCCYCACDTIVSQQVLEDGTRRIIIRSWCNYGNSGSEDLDIRQTMQITDLVRIDQDVLAQRNLRELYESGEDDVNDEETKKIRKKLREEDLIRPRRFVCSPQKICFRLYCHEAV